MSTPTITLTSLVSVTPVLPSPQQGQTLSISVDTTVLPYTILADSNTSQIEVLAYNQTNYNKSFTVINGQNQFTGSITIDPTQGDVSIQVLGRNYDPLAAAWTASQAYALTYRLVDPNGFVQIVSTAGTSGTTIPTFNSTVGGTTIDNGVIWLNLGFIAITPTLKYTLIPYISGIGTLISPPSGIRSYKAQTVCRLEWTQPNYLGVIGTRVLLSTDPVGINPPYVQFGSIVPPSQLSRSDVSVLASDTTVSYNGTGGTQTTTTVDTIQQNNFNYVDVQQTDISGADVFYAVLSTVVQDPDTQSIFESQQAGPLTCGFVNLKIVQLTDFLALQRKEDIAGRMISQVNRNYPNLDLAPRSELRDLMIDPVSIEISNLSVREWFSRVSRSVSGLAQIDNANGNGISDAYNSSPIKQQIARAYGLDASDTQTLIDNQFDVLGERAGLTRLGATASVVSITFYTYVKPTSTIAFPIGLIASTVADAQTPALNFVTTGSTSIPSNSVNTYYDPINGWWSVTVPASCQSTGSNTNVGAGTINTSSSGTPSGWNCTNLVAAAFGQDDEINSSFAARIETRLITGVDSGTRNGYLTAALMTPGIVTAKVVAAGDTEMLRDWDNIRQKHVYGCVDIYTKGVNFSEQDEVVAFQYQNNGTFGVSTTYLTLGTFSASALRFQIPNYTSLPYPFYQGVQLLVTRTTGSFYLGLENAQFDNNDGYLILDPNDLAYQVVGDIYSQVQLPLILNGVQATNKAACASLSTQVGSTNFQLLARYQSPLTDTPALQPVISVNSVIGSGLTGTVDTSLFSLLHTSDFLLNGGSNDAGDVVSVSTTTSTATTVTLTALLGSPVTIDSAMDLTVDANGNVGNVVSVRSLDQSTLYGYGIDYTITSTGSYHTYGITVTGSSIQNNQQILVTYNKFDVNEHLTFVLNENQTLTGTSYSILDNQGFVYNTWLPESYGNTTLTLDGAQFNADGTVNLSISNGLVGALIPHDSRYIKVMSNGAVMKEGVDYVLSVDATSGTAAIARSAANIGTTRIPDGGVVTVSYFTTEAFTFSTEYPAFVEVLANTIAQSKHAAADVLIKAMVANPVDITMTVVLQSNASSDILDPIIRSTIDLVLDNSGGTLYQSELIQQVMAITGVQTVNLPLVKCAKSDGSYNIGVVIPTATTWIPLSSDPAFAGLTTPANSWITQSPVLPDSTIPSGGEVNALVDLLYQGQAYTRMLSIQDFLSGAATPATSASNGSFYIIGTGDQISPTNLLSSAYEQKVIITIPKDTLNPSLKSYFVTYQVFGEGGASDIVLSSTEYLTAGRIVINYLTSS